VTSGAERLDSPAAPPEGAPAPRRGIVAAGLAFGLLVVSAGIVLWSQRGQAVFVDMLSSALAMCF
jgi:hypothetical protein